MPVSIKTSKLMSRVPEIAAEQQDRPASAFPRSGSGVSTLEQFIEGAEAAREAHQRNRAHQEVHLAQRKVMKLEAQQRRDVGVGFLLVRQDHIETDAFAFGVEGATGCPLP